MKREKARAEQAFELAEQGKTVCVISSGDAGIYGMAPLVYEMKCERGSRVEIEVLPGISAFQKAASLVGSTHRSRFLCDFPLRPHDTMGPD